MGGLTDQLKDILRENGCFFVRQGRGDHEIWESPVSGKRFPVDSNIKSRHTANAVAEAGGPAKDVLTSESVDNNSNDPPPPQGGEGADRVCRLRTRAANTVSRMRCSAIARRRRA
jgi:hypothetical protein